MKKSFFLSMFVLFCVSQSHSQTQRDSVVHKPKSLTYISFNMSGFYSPVLERKVGGIVFDLCVYPIPKWGVGLSFAFTNFRIGNNYHYTISEPVVQYYEWGIINKVPIGSYKHKLYIDASLTNACVQSSLADNAVKVKVQTRYGTSEQPTVVVSDYFYLLEPGLDLSYNVLKQSPDQPNIDFVFSMKYKYIFGNGHFSTARDYTSYYIGLGIMLGGLVR